MRLDARGHMPHGWDEETNVHIAADSWDKVDAAVELVEPLLLYVEEEKNIHKRAQMLQIAKINGTMRLNQLKNDKAGQIMLIQRKRDQSCLDEIKPYKLPEHIKRIAEAQYIRDAARVKNVHIENTEDQFQKFMTEIGGEFSESDGLKRIRD